MKTLLLNDIQQVSGGGPVDTIGSLITIAGAIWDVGTAFAQDNGGPSAADWCASVGYNY